jgi:hypothetical protein
MSRVIKHQPPKHTNQLSLSFEPQMHQRYGSLRECVAQGVYQRGLTKVAPSLNKAPGNLSVELSEDTARRFSVDALEDYIDKFEDHSPIYYLISKYLAPASPENVNAQALLEQMQALMRQAGLAA